jgi:CDP-diacylglycerol--glycerol-3-phosphate 3-phosphatidyltransferase
LWWCALAGDRDGFGTLVLICLAGDVLDGLLARALHAVTRLGALLDSLADALLLATAAAGVVLLFPDEIAAHRLAFWSVPAAWLFEHVVAFARYGRPSSFHTYLSRLAAVAMGLFGLVLFTRGFEPALLRLAAICVIVATIEELALLYLLPEWTPDVRGLPWAVGDRLRYSERP